MKDILYKASDDIESPSLLDHLSVRSDITDGAAVATTTITGTSSSNASICKNLAMVLLGVGVPALVFLGLMDENISYCGLYATFASLYGVYSVLWNDLRVTWDVVRTKMKLG